MSWQIDTAHTHIMFSARHMMIARVRGTFEKFSGTVSFDENYPEQTALEIQVETASVNTRDEKRDAHLRSPDFFNAEVYPYMTFVSKRVERTGDDTARLIGDLTIRDITREVALDVTFNGFSKSPWGTIMAGFDGAATINRKDWGLTWNVALETGGMLVSEEIDLMIELELVKVPQPEMA